jgi:transcriptional regulator GlxA family with amidase domain
LAKLTFFEVKLTKVTDGAQAEIAILAYPNSQLAAIHGLTDLFVEASRISRGLGSTAAPILRVTHWRVMRDGKTMKCSLDTDAERPTRPAVVIAPPTLKGPPVHDEPERSLARWLLERHAEGATLCSICGGAFLLAETGLLRDRRATTHWSYAEEFCRRFPEIHVDADRLIIDDGDIVTAGGIMAWTDIGLRLIDRFLGSSVMLATARYFLIDTAGREQRFYSSFSPRLNHGDEAVLRVQHWLQKKALRDVTLVGMAAYAGLEERTFLRRFRKATEFNPTKYWQRLRIGKAREMLELTGRTIDQVAWDVGYKDAASFRKVFRKVMGLKPGDYRKRFGVSQSTAFQGRRRGT